MRLVGQVATPLFLTDHPVKAQKYNFPKVPQLIMGKICLLLVAALLGTLILISILFVSRRRRVSIWLFF